MARDTIYFLFNLGHQMENSHIYATTVQDVSDLLNSSSRSGVTSGGDMLHMVSRMPIETIGHIWSPPHQLRTPMNTYLSPIQTSILSSVLPKGRQVKIVNSLIDLLDYTEKGNSKDKFICKSSNIAYAINVVFGTDYTVNDIDVMVADLYNVTGFGDMEEYTLELNQNHSFIYDFRLTRSQAVMVALMFEEDILAYCGEFMELLQVKHDLGNPQTPEIIVATRKIREFSQRGVEPHDGKVIEEWDVSNNTFKFFHEPKRYINTIFFNYTGPVTIAQK